MNSSIKQLKTTLDILTDFNQSPYTGDAARCSGYSGNARRITERFHGANESLEQAWERTTDFSARIFNGISSLVSELYKEVLAYTEAVERGEIELLRAVENANAAAERILAELGL